jgi:hypothetical protein
MTAKEKLRQTIEDLSEAEAQDALGFIVRRRGQRDTLGELLDRAPVDDETTTPEEDGSTALRSTTRPPRLRRTRASAKPKRISSAGTCCRRTRSGARSFERQRRLDLLGEGGTCFQAS